MSRVKRRLETTDRSKPAAQRNYSQLHSRTNDEKADVAQRRQPVKKDTRHNLRSQSKPIMGDEKTTEEDSRDGVEGDNAADRAFTTAPPVARHESNTKGAIAGARKSVVSAKQAIGSDKQASGPISPTAGKPETAAPGSKLEPIRTKESVTLKHISGEKRLKNSETCPDQLSPTLPAA